MIDRNVFGSRIAGAALGAILLAAASTVAAAQSNPDVIYLQDRVERLEGMLQLYGGTGGAPGGDPASAAALSLRIGQLEEQMRHLNGQVEQMSHAIRQLEDRLRRFSEDTEFRLRQGSTGTGDDVASDWPVVGSTGQDNQGTFQPQRIPDPGPAAPPQILGQVPGQPLDLTGALGTPGGFGQPNQQPSGWSMGGQESQVAALPMTGNPQNDYDTAYGHILRGEFSAAEASFRQFLAHYPNDELAGNAQYWLGESLFARARYRDAADAFLAGYTEHSDGAKAPDSLFKLGLSLKELGQREAACATLSEIGNRYPNAPQAVRERARTEMEKSGC